VKTVGNGSEMLVAVRLPRSTAATHLTLASALRVSILAVLFAAGVLLAGAISAGAQETTTATTTTVETTTEPTTVITTATVERTTTRRIVPTGITTSESNSSNETPAWVWVLLGILAVGLVALIVLLARRGGGGGGGGTVPLEERDRRLDTAVRSWTAQGWGLESQSADSAVLLRGGERLLVNVDQAGRVTTLPLPSQREG
jgi:hypothetical protein